MKKSVTILIALLINLISVNTNFAQNDRCLKYIDKISKKNPHAFRIIFPSPNKAGHIIGVPQINTDNKQNYYYFGWDEVKGANIYKIKFFDKESGKLIKEVETSRICFCYNAKSAEYDFKLKNSDKSPLIVELEVEAVRRFKKRNKNDCVLANNSVSFIFLHCESINVEELRTISRPFKSIYERCECN